MLGSMTRVAAVAGTRVGAGAVAIMDVKVLAPPGADNPELADFAPITPRTPHATAALYTRIRFPRRVAASRASTRLPGPNSISPCSGSTAATGGGTAAQPST